MPFKFVFYPDPADASFIVTPDVGGAYSSVPYTNPPDGRQGGATVLPDGIPENQGAVIKINKSGFKEWTARGFLRFYPEGVARLEVDDAHLTVDDTVVVPPDPTTPDPYANPLDIINYVFESTKPNLSSAAGCGKFTEDCCKELHDKMHPAWGHIKKNPGQNQFNGHAVDAIMLLVYSGNTAPAIYDIIFSSASPEAKPVFNRADNVNPELWYYPPAAIQGDPQSVTTYNVPKKGKK